MKKIYKRENQNLLDIKPSQFEWPLSNLSGNYAKSPIERQNDYQRQRKR